MKFKLPRQIITKEVDAIVSREMKQKRISLFRPSKNNFKEIALVSKEIQKTGLPKHLVRKKLTGNLGYGIFLRPDAKPIPKGQVIAPYAGEVSLAPKNEPEESDYAFDHLVDIILSKKEQAAVDRKRAFRPKRLYNLQLDGFKKGNFTRFINHSAKPNVIAHLCTIPINPWVYPARMEVLYMAKKTIHPGEQLLVSYEDGEKSYWGVLKVKPAPITPKTFQLDSSLKLQYNPAL